MKVYTKGGDKGKTSLIGGCRVSKNDSRVEAYGTVDELSAFIALLCDKLCKDDLCGDYASDLVRINSMLMTIEAYLACDASSAETLPPITPESIEFLEHQIDHMQGKLKPLDKFTIPGGEERVSLAHVCRTVCRRAERRAIAAFEEHGGEERVVIYLNRLSDYLYTLGRTLTLVLGAKEVLWIPEK